MNVIDKFEDNLEVFLKLKNYTEEVLTEPISEGKWSIREMVGHLLYWDKFNLEKMVPFMSNDVALSPFPNHDSHNKEAVTYLKKYKNVEEIIDDFVRTRKQLVYELKKIDQSIEFQIEKEANPFSIKKFVEIFVEHDAHHLNQIREKLENKTFKVETLEGYSPQIGHLVSMMNYARYTTLNAVKGLTVEQLDYLPTKDGNTIGALLLHMAAIEFGFQIGFFDNRKPNKQESEDWGAAYDLGEAGRREIKGYPLEFYIEKLELVRNRTLEELKKRNDEWLYEKAIWDGNSSNNYFIWFHTFEDEINHRGQIRIIKKMLPSNIKLFLN